MSPAWDYLLHDDARRADIEAVRAVLCVWFEDASEAVLWVQARQLLSTKDSAHDLATHRADDRKAIRRLMLALKEAEAAAQSLSRPTREALYHQMYMAGSRLSFDQAAGIIDGIDAGIDETPFSSRENVRAIFLVEDARSIWAGHMGRDAPAAALNQTSPFARFLVDLFHALRVGSEPRAAFQAWQKYTKRGLF